MSDCLPALADGHLWFVEGASGIIYAHDWRPWLTDGELILASAWSSPDVEITVDATGVINNPAPGLTTTRVSGGVAGQRAKLIEVLTTSLGQHPIRTIYLHVIGNWPPG